MMKFYADSIEQNTSAKKKQNLDFRSSIYGRKRRRWLSSEKVQWVLHAYRQSDVPVSQIADRFSVSSAIVSNLARASGLTLRGRGRRRLSEPSGYNQKVLRQAWMHTYKVVARRFGLKKQSVGRLVRRWQAWAEGEFGSKRMKRQRERKVVGRVGCTVVPKPRVVCFRIADADFAVLQGRLAGWEERAKSPWLLARLVLLDWLHHPSHASTCVELGMPGSYPTLTT